MSSLVTLAVFLCVFVWTASALFCVFLSVSVARYAHQ